MLRPSIRNDSTCAYNLPTLKELLRYRMLPHASTTHACRIDYTPSTQPFHTECGAKFAAAQPSTCHRRTLKSRNIVRHKNTHTHISHILAEVHSMHTRANLSGYLPSYLRLAPTSSDPASCRLAEPSISASSTSLLSEPRPSKYGYWAPPARAASFDTSLHLCCWSPTELRYPFP